MHVYTHTQSTDHQKLLFVRNSIVSDEYMQRNHRNHTMFEENFLNIWKNGLNSKLKHIKAQNYSFIQEIILVTCLGEHSGDSWTIRESLQGAVLAFG